MSRAVAFNYYFLNDDLEYCVDNSLEIIKINNGDII